MTGPRLVILVLATVVAACTQPPGSQSPSGAPGGAPTPAVDSSPTSSLDASGVVTAASARASPPPAFLADARQGAASAGAVGSWTLAGGGSDSPWPSVGSLPEVRSVGGARLIVRFGDGTRIGFWQALYARADDVSGATAVGLGGRDVELPPLDDVVPDALGPGDWVLSVRLGLAEGGSATYYWRLLVN